MRSCLLSKRDPGKRSVRGGTDLEVVAGDDNRTITGEVPAGNKVCSSVSGQLILRIFPRTLDALSVG